MTLKESAIAPQMDGEPWQIRAKAAGLSQKMLARLLGHAQNTISRQLRGFWESGIPRHIKAAIIAWEIMTPEQREEWMKAVDEQGDQ